MYKGQIPFPTSEGSTKMRENATFDLTLRFVGKKGEQFFFTSSDGLTFSMLRKEFKEFCTTLNGEPPIRLSSVLFDRIFARPVRGFYEFVKRGTTYGLRHCYWLKPMDGVDQKPKTRKTLFALCVDSSGSMATIQRDATVAAVNAVIDGIRNAAKESNQIAEVMLLKFGVTHTPETAIEETLALTPIDQVIPMGLESYQPMGGTPLFECIGRAIKKFQDRPEYNDPDVSFFVHAITDGEENESSAPYTPDAVNKTIAEMQATDRWTFALQVPERSVAGFVARWNVPAGNVQGWKVSEEGIRRASVATSNALSSYMTSRRVGVRSSKSVYIPTLESSPKTSSS